MTMEDFESNASGQTDDKLSEGTINYLEDKFGKTEQRSAASGENIDSYLNDRFNSPDGPVKREQTIPERFAELRKKRW